MNSENLKLSTEMGSLFLLMFRMKKSYYLIFATASLNASFICWRWRISTVIKMQDFTSSQSTRSIL